MNGFIEYLSGSLDKKCSVSLSVKDEDLTRLHTPDLNRQIASDIKRSKLGKLRCCIRLPFLCLYERLLTRPFPDQKKNKTKP